MRRTSTGRRAVRIGYNERKRRCPTCGREVRATPQNNILERHKDGLGNKCPRGAKA